MQSNPYLFFNGQCKTAFNFYKQCLGGTIVAMMTYGESPMAAQTSAAQRDQIMHAHLTADALVLMGSDSPAESFKTPQGFYVSIQLNDEVKAEQLFNALSENGTIRMPLQETFWAKKFAMFVDQFGIPWMINCGQPT